MGKSFLKVKYFFNLFQSVSSDQVGRIGVQGEILKEVEKIGEPEEEPDGVREYLENMEMKIEMKISTEKKIRELEEELKRTERGLKMIKRI
jgi:DNA-binding transcriptional regulator GbsR (MarR family)